MDCRDCRKVEDRKGCVGKEYFTYQDICFCRHQISWIISNFFIAKGDKYECIFNEWLPDPNQSRAENLPSKQRRFHSDAPFCKPIEIIAEVSIRLSRLGRLGGLLVSEIQAERIELSYEAQSALAYVEGWVRKTVPYYKWRNKKAPEGAD